MKICNGPIPLYFINHNVIIFWKKKKNVLCSLVSKLCSTTFLVEVADLLRTVNGPGSEKKFSFCDQPPQKERKQRKNKKTTINQMKLRLSFV